MVSDFQQKCNENILKTVRNDVYLSLFIDVLPYLPQLERIKVDTMLFDMFENYVKYTKVKSIPIRHTPTDNPQFRKELKELISKYY